jgi:hypothetical protein
MGGIGSGRRSSRVTTDECIRIRLPDLKHLGMIKRHCMHRRERTWYLDGKVVAQLTLVSDVDCREPYPCLKITGQAFGRRIDCLVWLDSQPMPFGGERWFGLCPLSGRRCTTLVLPPGKMHFASVGGWGVAYGSQRECRINRAYRAIEKASSRLNAMSKYSRLRTRESLVTRVQSRYMLIDREFEILAELIRTADGRLSRSGP